MKRTHPFWIIIGMMLMLLIGQNASAARLEADRIDLAPGEITTVYLKSTPLIAIVDWKVSPELELLDSDSRQARIRGKHPTGIGAGVHADIPATDCTDQHLGD